MNKQELAELDLAVAKALGWTKNSHGVYHDQHGKVVGNDRFFEPSTSWKHGGPIIEEYCITLRPRTWEKACTWIAKLPVDAFRMCTIYGPTPLIAAMLAFVASKEEK